MVWSLFHSGDRNFKRKIEKSVKLVKYDKCDNCDNLGNNFFLIERCCSIFYPHFINSYRVINYKYLYTIWKFKHYPKNISLNYCLIFLEGNYGFKILNFQTTHAPEATYQHLWIDNVIFETVSHETWSHVARQVSSCVGCLSHARSLLQGGRGGGGGWSIRWKTPPFGYTRSEGKSVRAAPSTICITRIFPGIDGIDVPWQTTDGNKRK